MADGEIVGPWLFDGTVVYVTIDHTEADKVEIINQEDYE